MRFVDGGAVEGDYLTRHDGIDIIPVTESRDGGRMPGRQRPGGGPLQKSVTGGRFGGGDQGQRAGAAQGGTAAAVAGQAHDGRNRPATAA
ncbi:hypothetical protein [Streptomyces chartreusis]|uniref:hypothetical protein n=1 Tax=Streptomyces chartreusis TaxID=1969 RepID=UPI0037B5ED7E